MDTVAINQAIRLDEYSDEMAWVCDPESDLVEGITDLLRVCASPELIKEYAKTNNIDAQQLSASLLNFIEKAIVNKNNTDEKILGTDSLASLQLQKFHYQLLMEIFNATDESRFEELSNTVEDAYQRLQQREKEREIIRFSEDRTTTRNYRAATAKVEPQISHIKTAIAVISAIAICIFVAMIGKLNDPASTELELVLNSKDPDQNEVKNTQSIQKISTLKNIDSNQSQTTIKASNTELQHLLKNLEKAYEKGDIKIILPILANTPEIKNQTNQQLYDKLETLFEITTERKMVLFNFNWTNDAGKLQGKGKFLSRYLLVGEKKWLTREGNASISATLTDNKLKVTQLSLEN